MAGTKGMAAGWWRCKVCGDEFPRPEVGNVRLCPRCAAQVKPCDCGCRETIYKYSRKGGEVVRWKSGHAPKDPEQMRENARRGWNIPGFREKIQEIQRAIGLERHARGELKSLFDAGAATNSDPRAIEARKRGINKPEVREKKSRAIKAAHKQGKYPTLNLERNPNWKGGISFEPYPLTFNKELKEYIRERDGRRCFICGKRPPGGKGLAVHHIDYNKENCHPLNLVALDYVCHGKTNSDRDYWRKRLSKEVKKRYAHIYPETH